MPYFYLLHIHREVFSPPYNPGEPTPLDQTAIKFYPVKHAIHGNKPVLIEAADAVAAWGLVREHYPIPLRYSLAIQDMQSYDATLARILEHRRNNPSRVQRPAKARSRDPQS